MDAQVTLDGPRRRKKHCPYGTDKRKGKRGRCLKHPRPRKRRR